VTNMLGESAYDLIVGVLSLLVLVAALCGLAADVIPARQRSGSPKTEERDASDWVLSPEIEQWLAKTAGVTLGQYSRNSKTHDLVDDVLRQIRRIRQPSSKRA